MLNLHIPQLKIMLICVKHKFQYCIPQLFTKCIAQNADQISAL